MTTTKNTEKEGWGNGFLAGAIAGSAAALMGVYAAHKIVTSLQEHGTQDQQQYVIQKDPVAQKTVLCDSVIGPLKKEMLRSCNYANFDHGIILQDISEKKDQLLEKYSCTPQSWQCKPTKPYDLDNSDFVVEFRYK